MWPLPRFYTSTLPFITERKNGDRERRCFRGSRSTRQVENKVISEIQIAAFATQNIIDKDRKILKLQMDEHAEQEITDRLAIKLPAHFIQNCRCS